MRSLTRIGKQPLKFTFEVYVRDVRGLPSDAELVAILWERSGKTSAKSATVATESLGGGSSERSATFDEKLCTSATLFRSAKRATIDAKPSTFSVIDMRGMILGSAEFDLAEFAELNTDVPARSKQLFCMSRASKRGGGPEVQLTIQMTISSHWHQLGDAAPSLRDDDDANAADVNSDGTPSDRSLASSALTHEALQALEASQKTVPKGAMARSHSFHKSVDRTAGKGGKEAGKVAELSQLAAAAAADARQAESRLATLQYRLRTEIIESTTETIERAHGMRKADEQAKCYHKHLLYVKDQIERIAADDGASGAGASGAGVSPLESEVLLLRRELAAAKMEIAVINGEKDELDHVAKQLNKQLATLASQHRDLTR